MPKPFVKILKRQEVCSKNFLPINPKRLSKFATNYLLFIGEFFAMCNGRNFGIRNGTGGAGAVQTGMHRRKSIWYAQARVILVCPGAGQ